MTWNDDPAASTWSYAEQQADAGGEQGAVRWSEGQLVRLENEWRRLQRSFAYHPHIGISPLKGDPPDEYRIDYTVRTLVMNAGDPLQFVSQASVHVWLPPNFPFGPPLVRPMHAVFHPNVVPDGIALLPPWRPQMTLADVLMGIGRLLAMQYYEPSLAWNPAAMQWIYDNPAYVPTDPGADFSPHAGGDPLERICRFAPQTLDQIAQQFEEMCHTLLLDDAPGPDAVIEFADRTRLALNLFLEEDIPDEYRARASTLDDAAREMIMSLDAWEAIRARRCTAAEASRIAHQLSGTRQMIATELRDLEALVREGEPAPLAELSRRLPKAALLHEHAARLRTLAEEIELQIGEAQTQLATMQSLPGPELPGEGYIGQQIEAARRPIAERFEQAQHNLSAELSYATPVAKRAQRRLAGLQRIIGWREYFDLLGKAHRLTERIEAWGSAGVEACHVELAAEKRGPFCFEQEIDIAGSLCVVRSPGPLIVQVIDAATGQLLAEDDAGAAMLPAQGATVRLTPRCDELAVQLQYLCDETHSALEQLQGPVDAGQSWLTRYNDVFASPPAQADLREAQEQAHARFMGLCADLVELGPFKQRLATWWLLDRLLRTAPALAGQLAEANKRLSKVSDRLDVIARASNRDPDTGQLQVAARFGKEYPQLLQKRDQARRQIASLTQLLESPETLGLGVAPAPQVLPALPEQVLSLVPRLHISAIRDMAESLRATLSRGFEIPEINEPLPEGVAPLPEDQPEPDAVEMADPVQGDQEQTPFDSIEQSSPDQPRTRPAEPEPWTEPETPGDAEFADEPSDEQPADDSIDWMLQEPEDEAK